MTTRLFRADSYLTRCDARIVHVLEHAGKPALILDQTVFYPTAGGQPHDVGTINSQRVTDVVEREDGEIMHILDRTPADRGLGIGMQVSGEIDWARRFDHMQQHSGQHVLSQAFVRIANLDTIAVHIGTDDDTLDLPASKLAPDVIERVETEANRVLAADLPFSVSEVSDADLARIPLRKLPKVTGRIRIVEVHNYDWSACGGTHVQRTAQIGLIKITRVEKRGSETRVTFRCGGRALSDYARLSAQTARLMELTSAGRYELVAALEKLQADARADHKLLGDINSRLLGLESEALLAETAIQDDPRVCAHVFESHEASDVRALAKLLTAQPHVIALFGIPGEKCQLIFARAKDAPGDMGQLLKRSLAVLSPSARGGGSSDFAQGGGIPATAAQIQAALDAAQRG